MTTEQIHSHRTPSKYIHSYLRPHISSTVIYGRKEVQTFYPQEHHHCRLAVDSMGFIQPSPDLVTIILPQTLDLSTITIQVLFRMVGKE